MVDVAPKWVYLTSAGMDQWTPGPLLPPIFRKGVYIDQQSVLDTIEALSSSTDTDIFVTDTAPPGGSVSQSSTIKYLNTDPLQTLDTTQADMVLRKIMAARTIEPEQFNLGTDQGNLQACINYGQSSTDLVFVKLRARTYTVGVAGDSSTALTWDGTHGTLIVDGFGATVNYLGTGTMWYSSLHLGGNDAPYVHIRGGFWKGLTAQYGHFGVDIRTFTYERMKVIFPVGAAFVQQNQDVYCERNNYDYIDDKGSKQLIVLDRAPFQSAPKGGVVTFTAATGVAAFTVPHTVKVGERIKFVGLSGSLGVVDGQTYYGGNILSNTTLTLSSTEDGLTPVTITANGTAAQGWVEPAGSMARTRVLEAKLQGGVATFCKIQITNGAGPYDSHFSVRGNIPDGVGIIDILGASTMGNTDLDLLRCEAVSSIAGGAFIMRWGQAGGFPPSLDPRAPVLRGMYMFDPLAPQPDITKRIFGQHKFHGIESQAMQRASFLDLYGRSSRALVGEPSLAGNPSNPSAYLTDGSGTIFPDTQIGHLVLSGGNGKGLWVDTTNGLGTTPVYQRLDALLDLAFTSSSTVRQANYNCVANEFVRAKPFGSNTITMTLPSAPQDKTRVGVKNLNSTGGTVNIACSGTDVFNETGGLTTLSLTKLRQSSIMQYQAGDGLWNVLCTDPGSNVAYLDGAAFTVSPTAPTPTAGDNSTKVATTAFAQTLLGGSTADVDKPISTPTKDYINSRGPNLVTNGSGLLGSNYNWSPYTIVTNDRQVGASLSYQRATVGPAVIDEFIAVNPAMSYDMTFALRQAAGDGTRRFYSYVSPYDVDKLGISPYNYMEQANTRTTLAADLKPGDTTVRLTSGANWNNAAGANTYLRSLLIWNYTDGTGFTWPVGTYSRLWFTDMYADGGVAGNIITLKVPWAGVLQPAGTYISNGSSGNQYMYGANNVLGPSSWTNFGPYRYSGVHSNNALPAGTAFPAATAYIKLGFLHHYPVAPSDPTSIQRIANVGLYLAPDIAGIAGAAPLNSPNFTGTPTAPTPAPGTATTQIATTAFVAAAAVPVKYTMPFTSQDVLTVKSGVTRYYVEQACTITTVRASVNTQPTGAAVIVDVNKNGTTIFTTQANRPTIAASSNTALSGTPQVTALAAGDYLSVDIDQIGSTVAGSDLTVQIGLA